MNPSVEKKIAQQLDPGECLLWSGQPRPGIRLQAMDAFLIPFSLLWGGFAIFWEVMALTMTTKAPGPFRVIFPLFGLPFVFVGLYLIFGRFFVDARIRARTYYGVTENRIIIISGLFAPEIRSLPLDTLADVSLVERGDGSGSISFGRGRFTNGFPAGAWPGMRRFAPPVFELIDQPKTVYDLIRNAQRTPPPRGVSSR